MARTKKAAPEPAVEDNGERDWSNLKDKDTTWMHEAFAEFIEDEAGIKVPPKHVQAVTAMRVAFRQSDTYLEAKAEAKAEQEAETEPEPEPAKTRRSRTAKAAPAAAKGTTRTRRSRNAKAEPEVTVGKDDETPKATRSRRTRRTAKTTEEPSTTPEAPF